jgi:hypothetical protein
LGHHGLVIADNLMPEEFGRTTARKRIKLPGGGPSDHVDVKVITKIAWLDALDRGQETQHSVDNSGSSNREVHVDKVYHTDQDGNQDTSQFLEVERIDVWKVLDALDRGQETQTRLDNVTGGDSAPPHFSSHLKTHVVRCYQDPNNRDDNSPWVDVELIDQFAFIDQAERGQETQYSLTNPANDDPAAQADPNDPDISDTDNGVDPPWRTDPFQNIVNFSGGARRPYLPPLGSAGAGVGGNYTVGNPIVPVTVELTPMNWEGGIVIAGSFSGQPAGPGSINIGTGHHGFELSQDASTSSTEIARVFTADDITNALIQINTITLNWSGVVFTTTDTVHYPNTTWVPDATLYSWPAMTGTSVAGQIHFKPVYPPQHWEFNTMTNQWEIHPGL